MILTIDQVLQKGIKILTDKGKEDAQLDARLLLSNILNYDRVALIINKNKEIDTTAYEEYMRVMNIRASGVPLQHIIGEQEFMGLPFKVNEHTLIPRRETEELVELALSFLDKDKCYQVMDVGTGSGCIPVSLVSYHKNISCIGIDISKEALEIAKYNSEINAVSNRVIWILSNLFDNVSKEYMDGIDMLISNPPYIKTEDIALLMTEVKDYEPYMALDGGEDGLDFYRRICCEGNKYLKNGGLLIFEIGYNQRDEIIAILKENHYTGIVCKKDLSGKDRIVYAIKKPINSAINN